MIVSSYFKKEGGFWLILIGINAAAPAVMTSYKINEKMGQLCPFYDLGCGFHRNDLLPSSLHVGFEKHHTHTVDLISCLS